MMKNNQHIILQIILVLIGLLCINQPVEGQIVFGQPPAGDLKLIYQSWTIEDSAGAQTKLTQWVIPILAYIPVYDNWEVIFSSSTAGSSVDIDNGSDSDLSGLNDTRISVYTSFWDDHLMLGMGLNLPTGKKALNSEEVSITNWLTESFLNFPVKNYGEGLGINFEAGYARTVDIYSFGFGAGYIFKTAYEPLDGTDDYKPGNQLRLGGFGSFNNDQLLGSMSMVYYLFSDDELDGDPVFRDGGMLDLKLQFGYVHSNVVTVLGFREIIRAKDKRIEDNQLVTEEEKSHGAESRVYLQSELTLNERLALKGLINYKHVAANGYDDSSLRSLGASNYLGLGLGAETGLTDIFKGYGQFEYYTGSADDGDYDLSGWQIVVGMGATF